MSHQLADLMVAQAWQIAVLAAMVAITTRTIAGSRPHLSHALWMLVLIKCVTPPIWGHSLGLFSQLQRIALEKTEGLRESGHVALAEPAHNASWQIPHADPESDIAPMRDPAESTNAADTGNTTLSNLDIAAERGHGRLSGMNSESAALLRPAGWRRISWYQAVLALACSGAIMTAGLTVVRYVRCLRLIHRCRTNEFDAMLDERLRSLTKRLSLRRIPRVIVSDERFGPAVLGLLRPTIVLPRCLLAARGGSDLPGEQNVGYIDAILAHELIHIRRGDLYTGMLQAVAQSLWWFHPAVWICNRGLSRESERCCDEQVIAELGCSPAQYARSLLSVIESRHQLQPVPVFPGMKPVEITTQRMERIMSLRNGLRKRTPIGYWLVVAALAIIVLPGAIAKPLSNEEVPAEVPEAANDPGRTADAADVSSNTTDAAAAEPEEPRLVITYSVADLVVPTGRSITGNDYLPLVEFLRTSVNPESWETGGGTIVADEESRALVIRQTRPAHEAILQLLRQLRKAHDSIQISCLLMKLSTDSQREGLAERCSLHPLNDQQRWALLTRNRGDEILQFLTDQSATVLSRPRIITISGQAAMMEIGSLVNGQLTGFRLSATPQVIADGAIIRLSHSVTIGALNKTAQAAVHESLLGSGQTLLLLVEQPAGGTVDRYVVLLTPESIEEEEDTEEGAL